MKLVINIDSNNAACSTREDVCRILERLLPKIRLAGTESKHTIRDDNGNQVGYYSISADDEDEDEGDSDEEDDVGEDEEESDDVPSLSPQEKMDLFSRQCKEAGYEVRQYHGRNYYKGPGVDVPTWDDVFKVGKATSVEIQTDNMGKGYIVYPKV
jgi:hypothetical protein